MRVGEGVEFGAVIYRVPEDSAGTVGVVEEAARFVARFGVRDEGFEREVRGVWAEIEAVLERPVEEDEIAGRMGELVSSIFEARRRYLGEGVRAFEPEMVRGARLVVCSPRHGMWDGLATWASEGFFHEQWDLPPLSTWVGYLAEWWEVTEVNEAGESLVRKQSRGHVVGLVPERYVEGVAKAIHVSAPCNINWLDDEAFLREHDVMRGF